jgi:hypothetical protein
MNFDYAAQRIRQAIRRPIMDLIWEQTRQSARRISDWEQTVLDPIRGFGWEIAQQALEDSDDR